MDAGDLKIFRAVAREGSISKAALSLNYVQSNVTTRIRQLEQQLQVSLFHRTNRGMTLTSAGENLLGYADKILRAEPMNWRKKSFATICMARSYMGRWSIENWSTLGCMTMS